MLDLDHYRRQRVIPQDTKDKQISDRLEFCHQTITTLVVTPKFCILYNLTTLIDALTDVPTAKLDAQYQSITDLSDASNSWASPKTVGNPRMRYQTQPFQSQGVPLLKPDML